MVQFRFFSFFGVTSLTNSPIHLLKNMTDSPGLSRRIYFYYCPVNSWTVIIVPPLQQKRAAGGSAFFIVIGVLAGGLVFLCPILPAVSGFQSLIILPALLKTLTLSVTLAIVLAILILSFFMVTLIGAIGSNRNISENIQLRLQASQRENILKESEERYLHIFNNAPLVFKKTLYFRMSAIYSRKYC